MRSRFPGCPPHRLEIEITESSLLRNTQLTHDVLSQLHALGVRISLDDFGTGYSSLSYLHNFPLQKVKIDRSFLEGIDTDRPLTLLRGVARLCRSRHVGRGRGHRDQRAARTDQRRRHGDRSAGLSVQPAGSGGADSPVAECLAWPSRPDEQLLVVPRDRSPETHLDSCSATSCSSGRDFTPQRLTLTPRCLCNSLRSFNLSPTRDKLLLGSCREYQMRSAAEATTSRLGRSTDLLDHVDYRLAETPEEKEEIYNLRYRAYLREGAISLAESARDRSVRRPAQHLDLRRLFHGELYSSVRISVLTSEWRVSSLDRSVRRNPASRLTGAKSSSIRLALLPIPTRPGVSRNCLI